MAWRGRGGGRGAVKMWLLIAAINGFLAVAAGAFGAHALRDRLSAADLALFDTAVRYQMWHGLALLGVAWLTSRAGTAPPWPVQAAGMAFTAGVVVFCGALYVMALTGSRAMAPLAPVGGLAFLVGWGCLIFAATRSA